MPFRTRNIEVRSDSAKWYRRVTTVFTLAGINAVCTEQRRYRLPHPDMLRHTFAVWYLSHGTRLRTVLKMLGHARTTTTENAYLPWVRELEEAHIADACQALSKVKSKKSRIFSIVAGAKKLLEGWNWKICLLTWVSG